MDDSERLRAVKRRTRRRGVFALLVIALYFSFVLNWTSFGEPLRATLPGSNLTGSILMFALLIPTFIVLEMLFLLLYRREERRNDQ